MMVMTRSFAAVIALTVGITACNTGTDPALPAAGSTVAPDIAAPTTTAPAQSFAGTDPAPEFPEGLDWINTGGPLTLQALRGKVVLLDFWTYGCINCIHIIPDLERLEREYGDALVVIGVHSAKFANEGATENIRQVILRYELKHPVVNDRDFEVWRAWGASAWPTIVLVDPAGNLVGGHAGEGVYDVVQPVISSLVAEFEANGLLDRSPIEFTRLSETAAQTVLSFPGKVLASPDMSRLFIADTGHHRIVAIDPATGESTAVYGSGKSGYLDGRALEARFDAPQGLALSPDGTSLYVADTDNHVIRIVDLATGDVGTLAGTGDLGWPPTSGPARVVPLNSPWDLAERDSILWIAMAGNHQLWSMDLASGEIGPVVGSAREGTLNGPLRQAELAQPSGLAFDTGGRLFFADSESSAIRYADVVIEDGSTGLVAGSDYNLFDFGDVDGVGGEARLQHPLGIAYWAETGQMIIADTYNSKLKTIDLETFATTTLLGDEQGWADGDEALFFEPGGLDIIGSTLYVADTNNHAIRIVDLVTNTVSTIVIGGIERFAPPPDDEDYRGTIVVFESTALAAGAREFILDIELPATYKVNALAPSSVSWIVSGTGVILEDGADRSLTGANFPVMIPATFVDGEATVTADLTVIYCRDDAESLCLIEQVRFTGTVVVGGDGDASVVTLTHRVAVPEF